MTPFYVGLAAPVGFALLHGILARMPLAKTLPPQKVAVRACALGALVEWIGWWLFSAPVFGLIVSLATAHVYFHVFNMSETARRIRHLVARYRGRDLSLEGGSVEKTILRLRRLETLGEIERDGTRFRSKRGPLTLAARMFVGYERLLFPARFTPQE